MSCKLIPLSALAMMLALPATAAEFACPDLATMAQVGSCPTEDELRTSFIGYCSDNARMYDKDGKQICVSFDLYRQSKNNSLWEAGEFQGYLSCATAPETLKAAKLQEAKIGKTGAITRVVCSYDDDVQMVMRTRKDCRLQGDITTCAD